MSAMLLVGTGAAQESGADPSNTDVQEMAQTDGKVSIGLEALSEKTTELLSGEDAQSAGENALPTGEIAPPTGEISPPSGWMGPTVVIDAGHQGPGQDMSGTEPNGPGSSEMKARIVTGTTGRTTGLPEYELNLNVALLLQEELLMRGYQVVMTRETQDVNLSNIDRATIANESGADIMVRIHANGVDDASVSGALCMVPSASNPYVGYMYNECGTLGQCIVDAYCEATGLKNDGLQEVDNMTGINWSQIPVTIIEMGFMTNEGDDLYMADGNNQQTMAAGIADGIDRYFQQ